MATDVARTTPYVYDRVNEHLNLSRKHYFDICPYVPYFEKWNDYDAEIQQYPPNLAINNFPWTKAMLHMKRMALKFLDEG